AVPSLSQQSGFSTTVRALLAVLDLARGLLKKALDRHFRREKLHLDRTLERMSEAVAQLVDPPTLARHLLRSTADLLGVERGAVYLRDGEPALFRLADHLGEPPPLTELSSGCPLVDFFSEDLGRKSHRGQRTEDSEEGPSGLGAFCPLSSVLCGSTSAAGGAPREQLRF